MKVKRQKWGFFRRVGQTLRQYAMCHYNRVEVFATMEDDEVVVVRRCRRYVAYTGYLNTFAVAGPLPCLEKDGGVVVSRKSNSDIGTCHRSLFDRICGRETDAPFCSLPPCLLLNHCTFLTPPSQHTHLVVIFLIVQAPHTL